MLGYNLVDPGEFKYHTPTYGIFIVKEPVLTSKNRLEQAQRRSFGICCLYYRLVVVLLEYIWSFLKVIFLMH
jgi:hypothetical protein